MLCMVKNGHPPPGLPAMNHTGNPYEHLRAQPQQPLNDSNNPIVPQKEQERQNNGNAGIPQQQQRQGYGGQIQAPSSTVSTTAALIPALSKLASSTAAPASDSTPNRGPPALFQSSLAKKSTSSTATPTPPPNAPTRNGTAQALIQSSSASKPQTAQLSSSIPNRVAST
uniref:Uncharacterized protein n=1 Tax=Panagrolaimus davidi TaxID=227884 RepID=A0A914PRI2_9BILA